MLGYMYSELVAARSLHMDGFIPQSALHLTHAWHALASLQAQERGEPVPSLERFEIRVEDLPNAGQVSRDVSRWQATHAPLLAFARQGTPEELLRRHAAFLEAPRAERKRLEAMLLHQLKLAEASHDQLHRRRRLLHLRAGLSRRWPLLAAALTLLLLTAGGLYAALGPETPDSKETTGSHSEPAPPPAKEVKLSEVAEPKAHGSAWDAKGTVPIAGHLTVRLGSVRHHRTIELSLDCNDVYQLRFFKEDKALAGLNIDKKVDFQGLRVERLPVPEAAVTAGYDAVKIIGGQGDGIWVLGHLVLSDQALPDAGGSSPTDAGLPSQADAGLPSPADAAPAETR